jgi:predicted glycoside hydrolase/deacetylase ChbG (UPF0249 family)
MTKYLIINADDYGYTPDISEGIRQAHLNGVVISTSAMMNGAYIERELPELMRQCPRIGVGVHLVLTVGKPVLPVEALPVLMRLTPDGQHFNKGVVEVIDQLDADEVRAEWRAQIEKFIRLSGHAPDHLDGHHHVMCMGGKLYQIYLDLARQYGCALRRPVEGYLTDLPERSPLEAGVVMPEWLDTRFYDEGVHEAILDMMIADLPEGASEWMCHPGVMDEALSAGSGYSERRADELDLLTRPGLRRELEQADVHLITFGELSGLCRDKS